MAHAHLLVEQLVDVFRLRRGAHSPRQLADGVCRRWIEQVASEGDHLLVVSRCLALDETLQPAQETLFVYVSM